MQLQSLPKQAPSQLCCKGRFGNPGPKTHGRAFQISPTGAAASACFSSYIRIKENIILNLWETNCFPLPSSLSVKDSMNHACLALMGPCIKVKVISRWKYVKLEDWTRTSKAAPYKYRLYGVQMPICPSLRNNLNFIPTIKNRI